jgi:hypothetical protein
LGKLSPDFLKTILPALMLGFGFAVERQCSMAIQIFGKMDGLHLVLQGMEHDLSSEYALHN